MTTPAPPALPTFGLPPVVPHLIAKVRNMSPELLDAILPTHGQRFNQENR